VSQSLYTPPQSPLSDNNSQELRKGSFLLGLILPFVIIIGGYAVVGTMVDFLDSVTYFFKGDNSIYSIGFFTVLGLGLLPIVVLVGLIIYFFKKGKTLTVTGMATSFGLFLLLIAAFVGIFIFSSFSFH